jgi:hypothetical protein
MTVNIVDVTKKKLVALIEDKMESVEKQWAETVFRLKLGNFFTTNDDMKSIKTENLQM